MAWFWLIASVFVCWLIYKLYNWLVEAPPVNRDLLRNITITCTPTEVVKINFPEVVKRINEKLAKPHSVLSEPIDIKNVISISTIPAGNNTQFVVWYKQKAPKVKKPKEYSPYQLGGNRNNPYKSYWS